LITQGPSKFELTKPNELAPNGPSKDHEVYEKEPTGLPCRINLENVSKNFGSKSALNNVTLRAFEGQITALVGHNGTGDFTYTYVI